MNVNFSAEDMWVDAEVNYGETKIEQADLTIETCYGERDVRVTLTDPNDSSKTISIQIADTRVEILCDALLAVAKKVADGSNEE